jgi:hypothetical protein
METTEAAYDRRMLQELLKKLGRANIMMSHEHFMVDEKAVRYWSHNATLWFRRFARARGVQDMPVDQLLLHMAVHLGTGSEQDQLTLENAVSDLAAALTDLCLTPTHAVMHIPWHGGCRGH